MLSQQLQISLGLIRPYVMAVEACIAGEGLVFGVTMQSLRKMLYTIVARGHSNDLEAVAPVLQKPAAILIRKRMARFSA